jgi:hypothetical protein
LLNIEAYIGEDTSESGNVNVLLIICSLFNDDANNSDYIASDDSMTVNSEEEKVVETVVGARDIVVG